ncbi:DUF2937 family protein [Blastochloris tepida]|nr:DUF2937 family protein [Blastochloris tepida]
MLVEYQEAAMLNRLFAFAAGALCAIALAQFPEFAQQYSQRLGGRLDELRGFVERFDADAARAGLTREQGLAEFAKPGSTFLRDRGADAAFMIRRFEAFDATKTALDTAAPLERLAVFVRTYDREVGRAAFADFRPAVPATIEGAVHAGAGFVIGVALASLIFGVGRRRVGGWLGGGLGGRSRPPAQTGA